MTTQSTSPLKLFYCYAREDRALRNELDVHMSSLKRQNLVTSWYDGEIGPGTEWEKEIDKQLRSAHIILLLITPHFMASDYCYGTEMKRALERHQAGTARVIPVILRRTFWEDAPFSSLQILPTGTKPVTQWSDRDEAFWDITVGIRKAVLDLRLLKTKQEWIDKGNAHHYLKHYEEALAAYEQAIHLDSNDAGVYVDKATTLINLERYEEALMASSQAIRLDSNNAFAYSKRGLAHHYLKHYKEALAAYEQAIRLNPKNAEYYNNKGVALDDLKRYEEALMAYEQAIHLDPNNAEYYNNKGVALDELRRSKEAQRCYEKARQLAKSVIVGETLLTYPSGAIAVAWSPDSTRIASVQSDLSSSTIYHGCLQSATTLHVWDAQTGHRIFVCDCPQYSGYTIMYSPDGARIATPSNGYPTDVMIWNAANGSLIANAESKESYNSYWGCEVAWSPDGKYLASINCVGLLSVRDADTAMDILNHPKLIGIIDDPIGNVALAWSPDGKYIAYEGERGLKVIEVVQLRLPSRVELVNTSLHSAWLPRRDRAQHLAWSPNGKLLSGTFGGWHHENYLHLSHSSVYVRDIRSGKLLFSVEGRFFRGTSWSPDSTKIALTDYTGEIIIYNVITGLQLFTYKNHRREIVNVRGCIAAWSPDGTRIASMDGSTIQIWKAP